MEEQTRHRLPQQHSTGALAALRHASGLPLCFILHDAPRPPRAYGRVRKCWLKIKIFLQSTSALNQGFWKSLRRKSNSQPDEEAPPYPAFVFKKKRWGGRTVRKDSGDWGLTFKSCGLALSWWRGNGGAALIATIRPTGLKTNLERHTAGDVLRSDKPLQIQTSLG